MICCRCLERSPYTDSEAVTIYQGNALCHNCFKFQIEVEQGQMRERERRGFVTTDTRIDYEPFRKHGVETVMPPFPVPDPPKR